MVFAGSGTPGISEEEVIQRIEKAVATAQEESDESVSDLLICLGQEEHKVEVLRDKLEQMGVSVDALLARAVQSEED